MAMSKASAIQRWVTIYNDVGNTWERSWPNLKYYSGIFLEGQRKTMDNPSLDNHSPDFIPRSIEYEYKINVLQGTLEKKSEICGPNKWNTSDNLHTYCLFEDEIYKNAEQSKHCYLTAD